MKWVIFFSFLTGGVLAFGQSNIKKMEDLQVEQYSALEINDRYIALVESLTRAQNSNEVWYREQHPDYYKTPEGFQAYNFFKEQRARDILQVRIEVQDHFCKKDKKYCWSESDLAFHQKELENKIEADKLYMEQFLAGGQVVADKALMDFHQDKNKELCEEFDQNCGVGEKTEVIVEKLNEVKIETVSQIPDVTQIVKKISETDYLPSTCKWVPDMPRRIIFGSGCVGEDRLCVGYVVCDQKSGGKFIRQSTCSDNLCGEKQAVACTKAPLYGSQKPKSESKVTVSEDLQKVLTNSTNKD